MIPPVVCVVGKKKSGKTTTVVGLVAELTARGHRVMTVKHGHRFELDTEGTDSWRHRHEAGAVRTVMAGPEQLAVVGGWGEEGELPLLTLVERYLGDADVVVVEGFKKSHFPRIEVFRRSTHAEPFFGSNRERDALTFAILTDVPDFGVSAAATVMDVDGPDRFKRLADLVQAHVMERHG